jgi:hypothetical protein
MISSLELPLLFSTPREWVLERSNGNINKHSGSFVPNLANSYLVGSAMVPEEFSVIGTWTDSVFLYLGHHPECFRCKEATR